MRLDEEAGLFVARPVKAEQPVSARKSERKTILVRPHEGRVLEAFGDKMQVKLGAEETGGAFVLGLNTCAAGNGPPPHIHHREDELFIIFSGTFRFFGAEGWSDPMGPGAAAYTPRGVRHTFQNCGTETGTFFLVARPSGFERFFSQCAEVFALGGEPDLQRIVAIAAEHQLEFVPPLLPA